VYLEGVEQHLPFSGADKQPHPPPKEREVVKKREPHPPPKEREVVKKWEPHPPLLDRRVLVVR